MMFNEKELAIMQRGRLKHFVIYYHLGTGTYVVTSPRAWARENSKLFPDFDFHQNHPTTNQICKYLRDQLMFETKKYPTPKISVTYRLDPFELDKKIRLTNY